MGHFGIAIQKINSDDFFKLSQLQCAINGNNNCYANAFQLKSTSILHRAAVLLMRITRQNGNIELKSSFE